MSGSKFEDADITAFEAKDVATVLLQLKHVDAPPSLLHNNGRSLQNVSSLKNIKATNNSAWNRMICSAKHELQVLVNMVKNIVDKSTTYVRYPDINSIFNNTGDMFLNGYMVILYGASAVLVDLRNIMHQAFKEKIKCNGMTSDEELGLFCKVISYINKYEISIWNQQTKYYNHYYACSQLAKFGVMLQELKEAFKNLLPVQRLAIQEVIVNNMVCIEKTGLLAKHAINHIMQTMEAI